MSAAGGEGGGAAPFPWDEAIAIGLARLRLHPDGFWRLTPRELMLMAGQDGGAGGGAGAGFPALDRNGLEALIARFGRAGADLPSTSIRGDDQHDRR